MINLMTFFGNPASRHLAPGAYVMVRWRTS